MIPRPDTVDDDLQVNRRTGILEECDLGNWPGQKLSLLKHWLWLETAVCNPGVTAGRGKVRYCIETW
jgi:hypothetical protein